MALESSKFFEIVQENGLVSDANLKVLRSAIKKAVLSEADLDKLVNRKVLTKWQFEQVLSGNKDLRIGEYSLIDFLGKDEFGEAYVAANAGNKRLLRVISDEIAADSAKLEPLLAKAEAFRQLTHPRLTKVDSIGHAAGKTLILSELSGGHDLVKRCGGKPQSEKTIRQLLKKIASAIEAMQTAGLNHDSINPYSVLVHDGRTPGQQSVMLRLPREIGFHAVWPDQAASDIGAVAGLAGGMLSGDFERPMTLGNAFAEACSQVATANEPEWSELAKLISSDSIPPVPAIPSIPNVDAMGELAGGLVSGANGSNVTADGLDAIDQKNDMFGDFENVEVASKIAAPQITESPAPGAAGSIPGIPAAAGIQNTPSNDAPSDANELPESGTGSSKRTVLIASIGGAVALSIIGLVVYLMMGGNEAKDSDDRVAVNAAGNESPKDSNAPSKSGETTPEKKDLKKSTKGLETKSSGLFAGVGEINREKSLTTGPKKDLGKPGKKEPDEKKSPVVAKKDPAPEKKAGVGQTKKPGSPGFGGLTKPGTTKKSDPNTPSTSDPGDKSATGKKVDPAKNPDPAVGKEKEPEKKDPGKKDPGKKEADPTKKQEPDPGSGEPLLVIGKTKKEKSQPKTGNKGPLKNPFPGAPRFVDLGAPKKGVVPTPIELFPLNTPPGLPVIVSLHGGDKASKSKMEFTLRSSRSEDSTWYVTAKFSNSNTKPVGRFQLADGKFVFEWDSAADSFTTAVCLINCALRIQAGEFVHQLALRAPVVSTPIQFEKSFATSAEAKLENPPNLENVKVVLVNIPKNFPVFTYDKGKEFLTGRPGSMRLYFQKEYIDVVNVTVSSKVRGPKLLIDWKSNFVTADKQLEKIPAFERFEQSVNQVLGEITQLQEYFKQLNALRAKIPKEQHAAFDKEKNRKQIENQIRAANPIKKHLDNAMEILKQMRSSKIGIRVYYQAGEIEVDLATPDGKAYVASQPAPNGPAGAPKKAKAGAK